MRGGSLDLCGPRRVPRRYRRRLGRDAASARHRLHRLRLRRVHGAVDECAAGLVCVAVSRGRHLPRRREPRVRRRQPLGDVGRDDDLDGLEPAAVVRRPAGAVRRTDEAAAHLDRAGDRVVAGPCSSGRRAQASLRTSAVPTGSPIYFDMEGYSANNAACTKSVQAFVTGWVDGAARELVRAGRVRQRRLDDPRRLVARRVDAGCDLDRELERRRRRLRRPVRERQPLAEPPARAPVQGRSQGDVGRRVRSTSTATTSTARSSATPARRRLRRPSRRPDRSAPVTARRQRRGRAVRSPRRRSSR